MRHGVFLILLSLTIPAAAQGPARDLVGSLRTLDAEFVCPERLPDDAARRLEVTRFSQTLAALKLNYTQALKVRANFLARHNCAAARFAQPMEAHAAAPSAEPPAQAATIAAAN